MATLIVSMICVTLIVVGGIVLSQGILTSTDVCAVSVEEISVREGEIGRTGLDIRHSELTWGKALRLTVRNTGQTKLASFARWDFIAHYYDASGTYHAAWLPYTENLSGNGWKKAKIRLNGANEVFEPGILNYGEELVALANLSPTPGENTSSNITIATANGVRDTASFTSPGYVLLLPHGEELRLAGGRYYELAAATADGAGKDFLTAFAKNEGGRKLLYQEGTQPAKFIFPLTGISQIPAASWRIYYRIRVWGEGEFPRKNDDVCFNIDILIRKADGTLRATIASAVASAYVTKQETGTWLTKSATYSFPGYTVADEDDYLEIDYYGQTALGPNGGDGYMELRIDDSTLAFTEQTRLET